MEKNRIQKSLNELENEFKNGNISKSQYEFQKRRLIEKLETLAVAERVMKLQGKKTEEASTTTSTDDDNDELFKKYITSPGLKEKNIKSGKRFSYNTVIASALLIAAFVIGIGFGIYSLNIPEEVSSVSLYTNDSAFPPFVLNNTTNATNATNSTKLLNATKKTNTTVKPTQTTKTPDSTPPTTDPTPPTTDNKTGDRAAGDPTTEKSTTHKTYRQTSSDNTSN